MGRTPAGRSYTVIFRLSLVMPFWVGLLPPATAQNVPVGSNRVVNQVVDNWITVAQALCDRSFYEQAQDSLARVRQYRTYLNEQQEQEVNELQQRIEQATSERKRLLQNIERAGWLIKDGEFLRAKTYLREAIKSDVLNEEEKNRVKLTLQRVEARIEEQKRLMVDLYKQSRRDYRRGDFEKARQGFAIVASSGLYVPSVGKTAEDYLALIEQGPDERKARSKKKPSSSKAANEKEVEADLASVLFVHSAQQQPAQTKQAGQPVVLYDSGRELFGNEPEQNHAGRESIKQSYIKAVIRDAETKAVKHVGKAEFSFAKAVAQNARDTLQMYRSDIGEQLYIQYNERLQRLSQMIDDQQRRWELRWDTKDSGL